ncbi:MAG: 4a-hydroxytetrahydrobiopterin dehydratase [Nanoarchaeota archaeon]|nr:4a-hydroxytetrahydrobiopterin dehydratase [Nanoarchaeota archaeon]
MAESDFQLLSINQINENLEKCGEWSIEDNGKSIRRDFQFENFKEVIDFVNKIAEIADSEGHHPDLRVYDYKNLEVKFTTHVAKGLTQKDFDAAEMVDVLL